MIKNSSVNIENELQKKMSYTAHENVINQVKRIIVSYRSPWDLYTELIQNAVDAIIAKFGYEEIEKGKIQLSFETEKRKIIIEDNGIGIKANDIVSILVLGESLKKAGNNGKYGFMGYGLTFVAFQTKLLKIETIHEGIKASRTFENLYKVIFDNGEYPNANETINGEVDIQTSEESRTKITLIFPNDFPDVSLEEKLTSSFSQAKSGKLLEFILRTKSAIGLVDTVFNAEKKLFSFNVLVNGEEVSVKSGYMTMTEILENQLPGDQRIFRMNNFQDIVNVTDTLDSSARKHARKATLIHSQFENLQIGQRAPLSLRLYISMTSKNQLKAYQQSHFPNDPNFTVPELANGIWLSIEGLPTGVCIEKFADSSYLPFTVIADVNRSIRDELDSGRKGISDGRTKEIVDKVKEILVEEKFIKYREYVTESNTRPANPGFDAKQSMINKFNSKEKKDTSLMFKYFPLMDEEEVICLFHDLIDKEILRGYSPKLLSSHEVYDGLYDYKTDFPQEILLPYDVIGIGQVVRNQWGSIHKEFMIIEFKLQLSSLALDVKNAVKNLNDIDLCVCWEIDRSERYFSTEHGAYIRPIDMTTNYFHGATHEYFGGGRNTTALPVIELKSVLKKKFPNVFS